MTNLERVKLADINELAKIIINEFCGMCRSCKYYYTPNCKYDEEANEVNPNACEKGIEEWLKEETMSENKNSKEVRNCQSEKRQ